MSFNTWKPVFLLRFINLKIIEIKTILSSVYSVHLQQKDGNLEKSTAHFEDLVKRSIMVNHNYFQYLHLEAFIAMKIEKLPIFYV